MRVAIAYSGDDTVADFKEALEFKLYDIENDEVVFAQAIEVRKDWYMSVAEFLAEQQADAVICGNIGKGALSSFREGRIKVYAGVKGKADDALASFINGSLIFDPLAGM